ncbi:putative uncharacterized protein DDB_G0277255 [Episyrphus balteatus]|uniref:putative uncharacterized protein DDB_G0277255 n=1 Tax=Episyrphus balteatus TaxID=286459 RepID=UPI002485F031|nr:putative uncharacterized protein DDB_G0277255 [Episyrphus balteatus]
MATTLGKVDLEKLKLDVQVKFDKIREALNVREKLLLRQIDVILTSRQHKNASASSVSVLSSTTNNNPRRSTNAGQTPPATTSSECDEIQLIADNEENILNSIRSYGKFNLDNINLALQDLYINEDYIAPGIDHDTMYKCLSNNSSDASNGNDEESIVVDFSTNKKLIRDNVSSMNESIINITLNEAKELIRKSNKLSGTATTTATETDAPIMPLNLEGILDEDEFDDVDGDGMPAAPTHSKSSQTIENSKRKLRFKPKITINNCNGTINLKNISNLTINCATEDSFKATEPTSATNNKNGDLPKSTTVTTNTTTSTSSAGSNHSSNSSANSASSSNAISPQQNDKKRHNVDVEFNDDDRSATCEFYNRLLNEIKNSLKQKSPKIITDNQRYVSGTTDNDDEDERQPVTSTTTDDSNGNETSSKTTSQSMPMAPNKKLVLRNFENLKIILEANDNSDAMRPVQIEQWLAEIISETEIEPMQNTDILEHSKIHGETC